jgi:hypothetical protein
MKITLKKGSIGAASVKVAEPGATSAESGGDALPPILEESAGGAPSISRRKGVDISGIIFAVLGFLAIAVFVSLVILQGSEISFYKAPESLWLK